MIYDMKLVEDEFDNVKYRGKIIEVRVNDEKRSKIVKGDKILFHKLPGMDESILVSVECIRKFQNFKEVYDNFPISYFGYEGASPEYMLAKIYGIYTKEEELNNGVVAIKFNIERNITN